MADTQRAVSLLANLKDAREAELRVRQQLRQVQKAYDDLCRQRGINPRRIEWEYTLLRGEVAHLEQQQREVRPRLANALPQAESTAVAAAIAEAVAATQAAAAASAEASDYRELLRFQHIAAQSLGVVYFRSLALLKRRLRHSEGERERLQATGGAQVRASPLRPSPPRPTAPTTAPQTATTTRIDASVQTVHVAAPAVAVVSTDSTPVADRSPARAGATAAVATVEAPAAKATATATAATAASAASQVGKVEGESHAALLDEISRLRDGWLAASEAHREERRREQVERECEQRAHHAALEALAKQLEEARRREQVEALAKQLEEARRREQVEALAKQLEEARRREQVVAVREGPGHASELQAAHAAHQVTTHAAHQVTKQAARALQVQPSASEAQEAMRRAHVHGQGSELEHAHAQLMGLSHVRRLEESLRIEVRDVRSELGSARHEVDGLRRMAAVMVRLLHGARQRLRELEVLFGGLAVSQPGMSRNAIAAVNRASDSEAASATKLLLSSEVGQMLESMVGLLGSAAPTDGRCGERLHATGATAKAPAGAPAGAPVRAAAEPSAGDHLMAPIISPSAAFALEVAATAVAREKAFTLEAAATVSARERAAWAAAAVRPRARPSSAAAALQRVHVGAAGYSAPAAPKLTPKLTFLEVSMDTLETTPSPPSVPPPVPDAPPPSQPPSQPTQKPPPQPQPQRSAPATRPAPELQVLLPKNAIMPQGEHAPSRAPWLWERRPAKAPTTALGTSATRQRPNSASNSSFSASAAVAKPRVLIRPSSSPALTTALYPATTTGATSLDEADALNVSGRSWASRPGKQTRPAPPAPTPTPVHVLAFKSF
jgi:hypothetical protein